MAITYTAKILLKRGYGDPSTSLDVAELGVDLSTYNLYVGKGVGNQAAKILVGNDPSISDLFNYEVTQDNSIYNLRSYVDSSLLNRDGSINTLFNYELIQDSSLSELKIYIDASLLNRDSSINELYNQNISQDASILKIDSSLNEVYDAEFGVETVNRTIYVETTGNDETGDGTTVGTAYATIYKALSTVKKQVRSGVAITIQCGLGIFNMGSADFDLWARIVGTVIVSGTMTLVNSGFTVGAAEALDPLSFNITDGDSATWTLDQWKWHFIKQGTSYYPITGNTAGPNPVLSLTTTAPLNEIYENGTTINFTFDVGSTTAEVKGNKVNEIFFYYIKFIFPDVSFSVTPNAGRFQAYSCSFISASSARYFYLYPTSGIYYCIFNNWRIAGNRAPSAFRNVYCYLNANSNVIQLWGDVDSSYVKSLFNVVLENPNTGSSANCIYFAGNKKYYGESSLSYIKFVNSNVAIRWVGESNSFVLNRVGSSKMIIKNTNYLVKRTNTADNYQSLQLILNSSDIIGVPNTRWFYDSMYEFVNLTSGRNIQIPGIIYPEVEFNRATNLLNNTTTDISIGHTSQNKSIKIDYTISRNINGYRQGTFSIVSDGSALFMSVDNYITSGVNYIDSSAISFSAIRDASIIKLRSSVDSSGGNVTLTYNAFRAMKTPLSF